MWNMIIFESNLGLKLICSDQVRHACDSDRVDTDLTVSDSDIAILAPAFRPLILELPVQAELWIFAVTHKLHCVPTNVFTSRVHVDATLVRHEVLHDLQAHKHRAIHDQLSLDLLIVHGDSNCALLAVILVVSCFATI